MPSLDDRASHVELFDWLRRPCDPVEEVPLTAVLSAVACERGIAVARARTLVGELLRPSTCAEQRALPPSLAVVDALRVLTWVLT